MFLVESCNNNEPIHHTLFTVIADVKKINNIENLSSAKSDEGKIAK